MQSKLPLRMIDENRVKNAVLNGNELTLTMADETTIKVDFGPWIDAKLNPIRDVIHNWDTWSGDASLAVAYPATGSVNATFNWSVTDGPPNGVFTISGPAGLASATPLTLTPSGTFSGTSKPTAVGQHAVTFNFPGGKTVAKTIDVAAEVITTTNPAVGYPPIGTVGSIVAWSVAGGTAGMTFTISGPAGLAMSTPQALDSNGNFSGISIPTAAGQHTVVFTLANGFTVTKIITVQVGVPTYSLVVNYPPTATINVSFPWSVSGGPPGQHFTIEGPNGLANPDRVLNAQGAYSGSTVPNATGSAVAVFKFPGIADISKTINIGAVPVLTPIVHYGLSQDTVVPMSQDIPFNWSITGGTPGMGFYITGRTGLARPGGLGSGSFLDANGNFNGTSIPGFNGTDTVVFHFDDGYTYSRNVNVYVAYGAVLSTKCIGPDKYNVVANGMGGTSDVLVQANAPSCGYAPTIDVSGIPTQLTAKNLASMTFRRDGSWVTGEYNSEDLSNVTERSGRVIPVGANAADYEIMLSNYVEHNTNPGTSGIYMDFFNRWITMSVGDFNTDITAYLDQNGAYQIAAQYGDSMVRWPYILTYTVQIRQKSNPASSATINCSITIDPQSAALPPPTYPANGTVLATHCVGYSKYNTVANGVGGSTEVLVENNSTFCGYTAPTQTTSASFDPDWQRIPNYMDAVRNVGEASTNLILRADGTWVAQVVGQGTPTSSGRYLTGSAANYEVMFNPFEVFYVDSNANSGGSNGTPYVWQSLDQDRMAGLVESDFNAGGLELDFTVTIRLKSNHNEQISFDMVMMADGACFAKGTLIRTPEGDRVVEELTVGEVVNSFSEPTMRDASEQGWIDWSVPQAHSISTDTLSTVASTRTFMASSSIKINGVHTTLRHTYFVFDGQSYRWRRASKVTPNDSLVASDLSLIPIRSIEMVNEMATFVALNVEDLDTLQVRLGHDGPYMLTHNQS